MKIFWRTLLQPLMPGEVTNRVSSCMKVRQRACPNLQPDLGSLLQVTRPNRLPAVIAVCVAVTGGVMCYKYAFAPRPICVSDGKFERIGLPQKGNI